MRGSDPRASFGPEVVASHDDELRGDEDAAAGLLAELARRTSNERVLELAIGAGRIAVPLHEHGLVGPSELDLMARLAGLRLVERWGGWRRQPCTGRDQHVSVYSRDPRTGAGSR